MNSSNVIQVNIPPFNLHSTELEALLERAAMRGAQQAMDSLTCYNYKEACKQLKMSYTTLQKRILEGKIKHVDGRITGAEIRRYLTQQGGNA